LGCVFKQKNVKNSMAIRFSLLVVAGSLVFFSLSLQAKDPKPPRAERAITARTESMMISSSELELVRSISKTQKGRPMDRFDRKEDALPDQGTRWESFWWDGDSSLFNTSGFVITGRTAWGENWKPFALIGLEDQVTFERYGHRRQGHLGLGVEYALTDSVGLFSEFRAVATSGLPTEGIARAGVHLIY